MVRATVQLGSSCGGVARLLLLPVLPGPCRRALLPRLLLQTWYKGHCHAPAATGQRVPNVPALPGTQPRSRALEAPISRWTQGQWSPHRRFHGPPLLSREGAGTQGHPSHQSSGPRRHSGRELAPTRAERHKDVTAQRQAGRQHGDNVGMGPEGGVGAGLDVGSRAGIHPRRQDEPGKAWGTRDVTTEQVRCWPRQKAKPRPTDDQPTPAPGIGTGPGRASGRTPSRVLPGGAAMGTPCWPETLAAGLPHSKRKKQQRAMAVARVPATREGAAEGSHKVTGR